MRHNEDIKKNFKTRGIRKRPPRKSKDQASTLRIKMEWWWWEREVSRQSEQNVRRLGDKRK